MAQKEIDNTQKVVDNVFSSIQSRLEEALCEEDDTNVRIRVQAVLESMPEKMDTVNGHFRCTKSAFNAVTKRLRSVSRPRPAVLPPAGEAAGPLLSRETPMDLKSPLMKTFYQSVTNECISFSFTFFCVGRALST